jgi:hypothetical protein
MRHDLLVKQFSSFGQQPIANRIAPDTEKSAVWSTSGARQVCVGSALCIASHFDSSIVFASY